MACKTRGSLDGITPTNPAEAADFQANILKESLEPNTYAGKIKFTMEVLTQPIVISDLPNTVRTSSDVQTATGTSSEVQSQYSFKGRIVDGDLLSPHLLLTDVCALDTLADPSNNPKKQDVINIINFHTTCISKPGVSSERLPNIGDRVLLTLNKGDVGPYDLQTCYYDDIEFLSTYVTDSLRREDNTCDNLADYFSDRDAGNVGNPSSYAPADLMEQILNPSTLPAEPELDPSGAPPKKVDGYPIDISGSFDGVHPVAKGKYDIISPFALRKSGETLKQHKGTDYAADRGTRVFAVADGVVFSGMSPITGCEDPGSVDKRAKAGSAKQGKKCKGFGNRFYILHDDKASNDRNIFSVYAHLHYMAVKSGQRVEKGQYIGNVGSSGGSQGPHLHFEIKIQKQKTDKPDASSKSVTEVNPVLWLEQVDTADTKTLQILEEHEKNLDDIKGDEAAEKYILKNYSEIKLEDGRRRASGILSLKDIQDLIKKAEESQIAGSPSTPGSPPA